MAKTNKKVTTKTAANVAAAPTLNTGTYAAHSICTKNGVTPAQVLAWVQQHANGNLANVQKQTKAAKLGGNWLWSTVALLNGGGKRTSAAHWGNSNVQLVVQPTAS